MNTNIDNETKALLDKYIGEKNYYITTEEQRVIDKYEKMIRYETEMRYPDDPDPCAKFPMDEEIYYRMEEDGYYKNGKFTKDDDIIVVIKGKYYRDKDYPRSIDNLKEEIEVFKDVEDHDYRHDDYIESYYKEQAKLKEEYKEYKEKHKCGLDEVPKEATDALSKRLKSIMDNYAKDNCFVEVYKIIDKRDGSYTFLPDTKAISNAEIYEISKEKVYSEELESDFIKCYGYLGDEKASENILKNVIDVKGPIFSYGRFYDDKRKEPFNKGVQFDIDKHYVNTKEELISLINDGKFDDMIKNELPSPKRFIDEVMYQLTYKIRHFTRYKVTNDEYNDILLHVVKSLCNDIPNEKNLKYAFKNENITIDLHNLVINDDLDIRDYYDDDDIENEYEDCPEPLVSVSIPISGFSSHGDFIFEKNYHVITVFDGREYDRDGLNVHIKPVNETTEFNDIHRKISNDILDLFEKETGYDLDYYADFIEECYLSSKRVPSVETFIEAMKEQEMEEGKE